MVFLFIYISMSAYSMFYSTEKEELKKMCMNTEEHVMEYALQGLRTLCMAKRVSRLHAIEMLQIN